MIDYQTLEELAGLASALGGVFVFIRKLIKDNHKSKKDRDYEVLRQAKEADDELRRNMDNKINMLDLKLATLEANVGKDIDHLKESYKTELKNLGEKIENLRTELSAQHGALLSLLTKLINDK